MTNRMLFALLTIATLMGEAAAAAAITPYGADRDADLMRPLDQPMRAPARSVAAPAPERMLSGNPLWAVPLRQLPATRERPLFTPSRRPPPPVVANARPVPQPRPAPAPKPPEPEKPQLALVGTVIGNDTDGIGVFLEQISKNVLRLKTGEAHNGWVLRTVQRDEVMLEKGLQTTVLSLPKPQSNYRAYSPSARLTGE